MQRGGEKAVRAIKKGRSSTLTDSIEYPDLIQISFGNCHQQGVYVGGKVGDIIEDVAQLHCEAE
jgi:hypothetical protein